MKTRIFTEDQREALREAAGADHSTHPTVVEYAVRFLFKRKGPAAAAKATAAKLHGHVNYFIDTGSPTSINVKTLEAALWDRLVDKVKQNIAAFKPGTEHIAVGAVVDHFKLGKRDTAKLKKLVKSRLGVVVESADPYSAASPWGEVIETAGKPLVLKRLDKTSWLCDDARWSVEAVKTKKGLVFKAADLHGAWKAGPFDTWQQVIAAMEKKTKRPVHPEGVRL